MKSYAGFTLIELLVAMAIFSIIGTVLFIQIHTVMEAKARVEKHAVALTQLQKTFQIVGQDIQQMIQRPHRNELGETESALIGASSEQIEFTRSGWNISPTAEKLRSELQRVRYSLNDDQLIRSYWPHLDGGADSQLKKLTLLTGVKLWHLRYWYRVSPQAELISSEQWPPAEWQNSASENNWPLMIECELETENFGHVTRLFPVPQTLIWSASNASGS